MESKFTIYNTLTRSKEVFESLVEGHVGMYVCGPTVYGDPHLGHARSAITFDLLFRYLQSLDYKVRYVRNITDVGHLENDADEGEDKIAKKARLDKLEPMEIAQFYTRRYHEAMRALGVLPPSIEPTASGHIIDQIEVAQKINKKGFAYKGKDSSLYFDVFEYDKKFADKGLRYGILSGRNLEDTIENTRALKGQDAKKNPFDFALVKKADPHHIMRWNHYPYSNVFPGWHLECTAMSAKYLGKQFDIHGGGMDLMFPHHECEIAQGVTANGVMPARYWMHNNMVTVGGQKMGKSLGNAITLEQIFTGTHPLLVQAYSPMTIRFFMLQAHYRSTLDFSNEALQAAEKGLDRLMKAVETLDKIAGVDSFTQGAMVPDPAELETRLREAMNDDLNSPLAVAALFDWVRIINSLHDGSVKISEPHLEKLKRIFRRWAFEILGLRDEKTAGGDDRLGPVMDLLLELRKGAKDDKNWALSDKIRDGLAVAGIKVKDRKDGVSEWELE